MGARSGKGGTGATGGSGGDVGAGGAGLEGGSAGAHDGGAGAAPGDAGTAGRSGQGQAGEAAGGTPGNGGSGGESGALGCGASDGFEIVPEPGNTAGSGWVSASTNCMDVSGPISVTHDAGSSISLDSVDGRICVSGHVDQGPSASGDRSTGARISIQLNNPENAATPLMYNALDAGVHGYRFNVSGATPPPELRPTFHIYGFQTDYCKRICSAGLESALFNESDAYCWDGTGALQTGVGLEALEFAIPARESAGFDFDFCLEDIIGITDNPSAGEPGACE